MMPLVNVKLVEDAFDADQKRALISKLTDAFEEVYPGLRDVTYVIIEETKQGDWGIGGEQMTAERVAHHARENATA